jgi:uncharacterized protein (DUF1499 family)/uncharacterized membrane protein
MNTSPAASLHTPRWPSKVTRSGLWIIAAGVLLAAISGPLYRLGIANLRVALLLLPAGFFATVIGTVTAIIGVLAGIAKRSPVADAAAAVGIVVGLALIGYMLHWMSRARATPPIHDVTTDLADPPAFVAVLPLRAGAHAVNSAQYIRQVRGSGGRVIDITALQRQYFPDLQPLQLPLPPAQALEKARRVASELHWQVDAYTPAAGRLEATAQTAFFGFKDDVVVRVRPSGSGSRIDIRSDSRVGFGDVGTNAARIRAFLKRMAEH